MCDDNITLSVFRASSHTSIPLDSKTSTHPKYCKIKIYYLSNYYIHIIKL